MFLRKHTKYWRAYSVLPYVYSYNVPHIYLVARIAVPSHHGPYYRDLETSRFLNGTVYSYRGYFRFGSGFMPVFVMFYGSLMVHIRVL